MAKTKISFDIDKNDFDKLKVLVDNSHITRGDFLRQVVGDALKYYDDKIMTVYLVENGSLSRKVIHKSDYTIEIDDSLETKELMEDFFFVKSGFLIKDGVKMRFYSKIDIQ